MELHNRELSKSIADSRPATTLPNDQQFLYTNRVNVFDPNLCSAAEYSPPPSTSYAPSADASITYSNVIYLPTTIALGDRDDVKIVKNETLPLESSSPYKYIASSDPRYATAFSGTEVVENAISVPNHIHGFVESAESTANANCDENLVFHPNAEQYAYIDADYIHQHRHKHSRDDADVVLQGPNGQLYRHVHSVFVNHDGDAVNAVELMPTLISEEMTNEIGYATHATYDQTMPNGNDVAYQMATNIDETLCGTNGNKQMHHSNGSELMFEQPQQQYTLLESLHQNSGGGGSDGLRHHESNPKMLYPTKNLMEKDHQRILLESTMSPLLAAVNDITAREEQYQSYLAQNKIDASKSAIGMDYYYDANVDNQAQPQIDSRSSLHFTGNKSKSIPKPMFMGDCENTRTSCASPADEYVDINEMEFIDEPNGGKDDNLLMRRTHRRKTTKKCEELLVVDKHVPSRAWATLPTSYLYFGNSTEEGSSNQLIYAKKDIPLRTKFGPFEGDVKVLDADELLTYRSTRRNVPLLFVDETSILDVSNEKTSNWMRFVYLAAKYMEQNLLLYEIDGKLYFKSCQFIAPKQQLRVGYSKDYAKKYKLPLHVPDDIERQKLLEKQNPWICLECNKRFSSVDKLNEHSTVHTSTAAVQPSTPTKQRIDNGETNAVTSSATKCSNHRLNTGAIRKRKLALSKNARTTGPTVRYACCYCSKVFTKFSNYKKHTSFVHSMDVDNKRLPPKAAAKMSKENMSGNTPSTTKDVTKKWFVCATCRRYFASEERLQKHEMLQCIKNDTKSVQCQYCPKRVLTPSALTMHMRTHNNKNGVFECPFCKERYQNTLLFKEHVKIHMDNGIYRCLYCESEFPKYSAIRKHMQLNHSAVRYKCSNCPKEFKSRYKLKEHKLSHSDVRQFLCADCGKQFKRKDKLREHILKIHATKQDLLQPTPTNDMITEDESPATDSVDNLVSITNNPPSKLIESDTKSTKFRPKVAPTDYQRFIYKCNDCKLSFKRRGMLVNHMAKHHPDVSINSVPELNLPILQTQRCYFCTYCVKVYKSNSKRKAHILKHHPGRTLPQSARHKGTANDEPSDGLHDASFTESISDITTHAHQCHWCYKQYASKTRLLQHQRQKHAEEMATINIGDFFPSNNHHHPHHHHHQMPIDNNQTFEMNKYDELPNDEYKLKEQMHTHQRYMDFEPENKLLKLSSAALDFEFFDNDDYDKGIISDETTLSKVDADVNFRDFEHCERVHHGNAM